ncbi:formylglycine-generating enzyme family protein [Hyphomicrobium album]|nr:formylglycine-generating enzyme family protein [Hyphomicrobium album]
MSCVGDVLRIAYIGLLGPLGALAFLVGNANSAQPSCASYRGFPQDKGDKGGMVFVGGGSFVMGSDRQRAEERSSHVVKVDGFWIDQHEVTNAQFASFVGATGYKTIAERGVNPKTRQSLYAPGSVLFIQPTTFDQRGRTQWWKYVNGANWRAPEGPRSSIKGRENHPVVHVAYEDALAYARWRGRELPTEAQWEFAARGGKQGDDWSQAFDADGKPTANSWQGVFPAFDTREDGYTGTAPVGCFPPNDYGLYDMIGNVWEWTNDWYVPGHPREPVVNPTGPNILRVRLTPGASPSKVIKGGSYLCAPNFCSRYRSSARQPQEADLSAGHIGFRTVLNARGP